MTSTPQSLNDETLNESWVELNYASNESSLHRDTPPVPFVGGNLEKLLLEAQRESNQSSAKGSGRCSRESPKSPHSPSNEPLTTEMFIINKEDVLTREKVGTDWIWDWSSRPDQHPPKEWKFKHPRTGLSLRHSKIIKRGLFSSEVLPVLILSNILSVLLGAGLGLYIGKRWSTKIFTIPLD